MTTELVVARYKEDISWTQHPDFKNIQITVYDKSGDNPTAAYALPNVGNEAHTYLYHMATNYDSLSMYTAFVQGNPFDHVSRERLLHALHNPVDDFVWLADLEFECDWQALPHHPGLPLAQMYAAATGRLSPPHFRFGVGGQFMVSKKIIRKKPTWFYEHNINVVRNGFTGHPVWCGYERFWDQLFT